MNTITAATATSTCTSTSNSASSSNEEFHIYPFMMQVPIFPTYAHLQHQLLFSAGETSTTTTTDLNKPKLPSIRQMLAYPEDSFDRTPLYTPLSTFQSKSTKVKSIDRNDTKASRSQSQSPVAEMLRDTYIHDPCTGSSSANATLPYPVSDCVSHNHGSYHPPSASSRQRQKPTSPVRRSSTIQANARKSPEQCISEISEHKRDSHEENSDGEYALFEDGKRRRLGEAHHRTYSYSSSQPDDASNHGYPTSPILPLLPPSHPLTQASIAINQSIHLQPHSTDEKSDLMLSPEKYAQDVEYTSLPSRLSSPPFSIQSPQMSLKERSDHHAAAFNLAFIAVSKASSLSHHAPLAGGDWVPSPSPSEQMPEAAVQPLDHASHQPKELPSGAPTYGSSVDSHSVASSDVAPKQRARSGSDPPTANSTAGKYFCTACDKRFTRPSALAVHSHMHTGEKPFSCLVCHRSFSVNSNLRRHMKTHSKKERSAHP